MGVGVSKPAAVTADNTFGLKPRCEKLMRKLKFRGARSATRIFLSLRRKYLLQRFAAFAQDWTEAMQWICPAMLALQIRRAAYRRKGQIYAAPKTGVI